MSDILWPHDARCAVSLKFDDGLESHLSVVVPMLDDAHLKGTFYICPTGDDDHWRETAARWQPIHDAGHEIGNHSLSHPIPAALADEPVPGCYEELTPAAYEQDVLAAQQRLAAAFDRTEWTFCYPCYQTEVGVGRDRRSVVPFIAEHFAAACAGGEISRATNPPDRCDLHALLTIKANALTGDGLIDAVRQVERDGRWGIFTFHDIGPGRLPVARDDFQRLIDHLADHRDTIWTATVAEVASCIRGRL